MCSLIFFSPRHTRVTQRDRATCFPNLQPCSLGRAIGRNFECGNSQMEQPFKWPSWSDLKQGLYCGAYLYIRWRRFAYLIRAKWRDFAIALELMNSDETFRKIIILIVGPRCTVYVHRYSRAYAQVKREEEVSFSSLGHQFSLLLNSNPNSK